MGRIQQVMKLTDWQSILGYCSKLLELANPDSVCLEVGFSVATWDGSMCLDGWMRLNRNIVTSYKLVVCLFEL